MFDNIISYSIKNKFVVMLSVFAIMVWGVYSLKQIPIDAVPDITNNQVQIITTSPTLATAEIEKFITSPIELSLQNVQNVENIRSISRFGLSVITVVFEEDFDIYLARQLINESLKSAQENIPEGLGTPELSPISTGLGEIYQYTLQAKQGYKDKYDVQELRTIQDWIVKRQLSGIKGVAEINTTGGYLKQYEVSVDPYMLKSMNISIDEVFDALENSNENTGGAYIEKNSSTYYIRSEGLAKSLADIGSIVVKNTQGTPILIRDIAKVQYGKAPRYGASVRNQEETVIGKVMMFKGANSSKVTALVKERVLQIQESLPEGVEIRPYLIRDKLVNKAISTVKTNLIEGGLIVLFILVLLLGNWRAGLIVASVIPIAMLFAISMMNLLGISANLMSLGAIDFGLIVDGAVIIVEAIVHRVYSKKNNTTLSQDEMDEEVAVASKKIRSSAAFGEIIILMVYIPILALVGIEGKMFKPMAQTVMLAILGALVLSLTYVPMMSALFLNKKIVYKVTFADRIISFFQKYYKPLLEYSLRKKKVIVLATILLFFGSVYKFSNMGGEFIPVLEEGDLAMQHILSPGSSLTQSVDIAKKIQKRLKDNFPEIIDIVANIGSAEIPTDPMPVEVADYVLIMKPKDEWTSAESRQELFNKMEIVLRAVPGVGFEFSQPIQLRFNELMTGTKADIAIKLYGEDLDIMFAKAKDAEKIINKIKGVATVNVEQTIGMPQILISYKYKKLAQYGLHVKDVNRVIRTAFAGEKAGVIYEGEKRFDLVLRMNESNRTDISNVKDLFVTLDNGSQISLSSVAKVELKEAPMQISRENTNRRIVIGVNVGADSDTETLVSEIQKQLSDSLDLPSGYYLNYGGQFENLKAAKERLGIALPIALIMIFVLLYFTFGSFKQSLLIFTAIPLSAIGGVWALVARDLPFSISAGIGFIALFGVAVLNGIVLIGYFNQLKKEGMKSVKERIMIGTMVRLRPVIMTASVASLGFLPMAISNSSGAEVQRPLATVVIGGLISATFLTLVVLPVLYSWSENLNGFKKKSIITILIAFVSFSSFAQKKQISIAEVVDMTIKNHPEAKKASLLVYKMNKSESRWYGLGNTDFSLQKSGFIKGDDSYKTDELIISQSLYSPTKFFAEKKLLKAEYQQEVLNQIMTNQQLINRVKKIYYKLQLSYKYSEIYKKIISDYDLFIKKSEIRTYLGDTSELETMSLSSKRNEYLLAQQKNRNITISLEYKLKLYTGSEVELSAYDDFNIVLFEDNGLLKSIFIDISERQIDISERKKKFIASSLMPNVTVSYVEQKYNTGYLVQGIQLGLSVPLFFGKEARNIKLQKIQTSIDNENYNMVVNDIDIEQKRIKNDIDTYLKGVGFYKNQVEVVNLKMEKIYNLNYEAGEISYLELLNTTDMVLKNKLYYWEYIYNYNCSVADYQFITNY
ncbi:MAG: CusA/CzcA family heavy metal efflux RND transporter [Flavobacteriaceae bacterium]|nr:CusA/CzcA family heavy metal efflux RND transporter [Flavobacteriaceae bacterium]